MYPKYHPNGFCTTLLKKKQQMCTAVAIILYFENKNKSIIDM